MLSTNEKAPLAQSIEDIFKDAPSVEVSALRLKKVITGVMKKGKDVAAPSLYDILTEVGAEGPW